MSNLLSTCPVEHIRGKSPKIFLHDFETLGWKLSTIWWNKSSKFAESAFYVSKGKFCGKLCFLKKMSVFVYLFQTISIAIILLNAFVFWQCVQSCFLRKRRKKKNFFPETCLFCWNFRTLSKNFDAVRQTFTESSSKLFFTCPLQLFRQEIFLKVQSIIIFRQFLGKITTFGEKFLAFVMFFAFLTNMFLQLQRNVWVNFSRKKKSFSFIGKLRKRVLVLCWMFSTGLSKLQSLCPSEHFEESLYPEKMFLNFNWAMDFRLFVYFSKKLIEIFSLRQKKISGEKFV